MKVIYKAPATFEDTGINIGGGHHNLDANRCLTLDEGDYPGLDAMGFKRLTPDEVAKLPQAPKAKAQPDAKP
jgi:hypothetical protein